MTFTTPGGVPLTTSDKVKWVTSGSTCDETSDATGVVAGGNGVVMSSATTAKFALTAIAAGLKLCLKAGGSGSVKPYTKYHTTTVTAATKIPKITSYSAAVTNPGSLGANGATTSVHAEVATTFTFVGFGLCTDIQLIVSETTNCATILTGGTATALAGAVQAASVGHGSVTQNTKGATISFNLKKAFVNAALCINVPTAHGGSGGYIQAQISSLVVDVIGSARSLAVVDKGANFFAGRLGSVGAVVGFSPPRIRAFKAGGSAVPESMDASGIKTITATITTNGGTITNTAAGGYGVAGALSASATLTCGLVSIGVVATANTAVSFTLPSGDGLGGTTSTTAGAYVGYQITVVTAGVSKTRLITAYTTGRVVTVATAFTATPTTASAYSVSQEGFSTTGTISATTSTSVFTLATTASTTDDYYNGMSVTVGAETRTIADYAGVTRQVTITGVFGSSPSGAYHISEADLATGDGYAAAAGGDTKLRVCAFPDMYIDAYGEGYVLTYTVTMINGADYVTAYSVAAPTIAVSGNAMNVLETQEAEGWVVETVPTTNGILKLTDAADTDITNDKLTGCCTATASIHTNHKDLYNMVVSSTGDGALTGSDLTEAFTSGVSTFNGMKIDHYGKGYRLTYTPKCTAETVIQQNAIKTAAITVQSDSSLFEVAGTGHHFEVHHYNTNWVNDRTNTNTVTVRVVDDGGGGTSQPGTLITDDDVHGIDRIQVTVHQRPQINNNLISVASYAYTSGTPIGDGTLYKDAGVSKLTDGVYTGQYASGGVAKGPYEDASVVGWPRATSTTITFTLSTPTYLNTATIGYIHSPSADYEPHLSALVYAPSQIVVSTAGADSVYTTGWTFKNLAGGGSAPSNTLIDETCGFTGATANPAGTCGRNEVTWVAAKSDVKYIRLTITGPSSGTYYMLDEVFFTTGYGGGAGTFNE